MILLTFAQNHALYDGRSRVALEPKLMLSGVDGDGSLVQVQGEELFVHHHAHRAQRVPLGVLRVDDDRR
jgi:hypothetical protein